MVTAGNRKKNLPKHGRITDTHKQACVYFISITLIPYSQFLNSETQIITVRPCLNQNTARNSKATKFEKKIDKINSYKIQKKSCFVERKSDSMAVSCDNHQS